MIYRAALMLGPLFAVHSITKHGRCTCGAPKCAHPGKHPATANGCYDAMTDEAAIERELARGRNLGLHTVNVYVLDVDPRSGGDVSLAKLLAEYGPLPETPVSFTGGGGHHYFFELPAPDLRWHKGVVGAEGIDVKAGAGSLVVVAPSKHASGRQYVWDASPEHTPLAPLPGWLFRRSVRMDRDRERGPATGKAATSLLGRAFELSGMVRHTIDSIRIAVQCPWESEHSSRGGSSTSTVVFAPTAERPNGAFHCSHAHCIGRTDSAVLEALPPDCVSAAVRAVVATLTAPDEPEPPPDGGVPCPLELAYLAAERDAIQWESAGCPAVWPIKRAA